MLCHRQINHVIGPTLECVCVNQVMKVKAIK